MTETTDHLDEATWERLATGALGDPARQRALDHVVGCRRCTAVYRSVLALTASAREEGLLPRPTPPVRRWLPAGLAAMAACAALFALWPVAPERLDQPSAMRGGELASVALLPTVRSQGGRPELAWAPVEGATRYRVAVFTEEGLPVWSREVDAPPVRWPAEAPEATGACRWRVEALRAGGLVARSPLTALQAAP